MPLVGYTPKPPLGGYIRNTDGAGPFSYEEAVPSGAWIQLPSGTWMRADGSGPYSRDVTGATAVLIFPLPV